ncbi:MAG: sulfite exporter TauE/SafE family protein [Spirochaetota bacterium]|nr:sulfite exporter TauE/SafE family protein [Spirochaetota bacterium]
MFYADQWHLFDSGWFMSVTMILGSFIAGASSEGGGAVAFPVMTLIYNISPEVARNFSLAIQSIGMTTASYIILKRNIPIEKNYLILGSAGGFGGIIIGTLLIAPYVFPSYMKMLFFSFWLSFAFVLFYLNHIKKSKVVNSLPKLDRKEKYYLILTSTFGGILTSILGSGIDIVTFSYVTLRFRLSEKIATPTSVIIMATNSIMGFLIHLLIIRDFGIEEFNYWLVCIPVVVIGAPIGAYVINILKRLFIARFLYIILLVQFIFALIIIKPQKELLLFTVLIFIFGILFYTVFGKIIPISLIFKKISSIKNLYHKKDGFNTTTNNDKETTL